MNDNEKTVKAAAKKIRRAVANNAKVDDAVHAWLKEHPMFVGITRYLNSHIRAAKKNGVEVIKMDFWSFPAIDDPIVEAAEKYLAREGFEKVGTEKDGRAIYAIKA